MDANGANYAALQAAAAAAAAANRTNAAIGATNPAMLAHMLDLT